ncbi:MAG: FAD-dependent oxidoreductase [Sporichthyaceae bacterium]
MARAHAVVVGAGISGLLAARVLADFYEHVTVVERDEFPRRGAHRAGTPQDAQWHLLMPSAAGVMEDLFHGLLADLAAAGAPVITHLSQAYLEVSGHRLCQDGPLPAPLHLVSRPMLETHLRAQTSRRVLVRPGVKALDLLVDDDRVTGIVLAKADGAEILRADLVVDATAGALQPFTGLGLPDSDRVEVDVRQYTVEFVPRDVPAEVAPLLINGPDFTRPRGVAVTQIEGGRWQLMALGFRGNHPRGDRAALTEYVAPMLPTAWVRMLEAAQWATPVPFDFPASVWRRYDMLECPPDGLLTVGDGLCRMNPVHSNGMKLAARQAVALRECLEQGNGDLALRWYRASGELISREWQLTSGVDRLCAMPGDDQEALAKTDKLLHKILTVAETDAEVVQNLLRVQWGMAAPTAMFSPSLIRKLVGRKFIFGRGKVREPIAS